MARHRLIHRAAAADLAVVTGDLCGLHAQVMSCAELSLWARVDGLDRDFLGGYAPATAEDLTRWWLGPPRPRRGAAMLAAAGGEATGVTVGGKRAFVLARDLRGHRLAVETEPFGRLPAWAREQLHAEAERLAAFPGCVLATYS